MTGMPGMGGYKCLKQLFRIDPKVKVFIASGYAPAGMIHEMLESGALGFIEKPYRLQNMLQSVRKVFNQNPKRRSAP
jgi:DNA-binding NtrC family response regulator